MLLLIVAIHMLPPSLLSALGIASDIISDSSPAILRPILHVLFTVALNY